MPVNPDDLLIFKMRGMRTKPKKVKAKPKAKKAPAAQPEEAALQPEMVAQPQPMMQPAQPHEEVSIAAAAPSVTEAAPKTGAKPEEETTPEESERLYGYAPLEERAQKAKAPSRPKAEEKAPTINVFAYLTGILFIVNAAIFGYFTYPQAIFLANQALVVGMSSFIATLNLDYVVSLVNLALVLLSLLVGIVVVTSPKRGHLSGAFVNSAVILAVTFEYLNSNTNYLLFVNGIAFLSIVSLVYARMSSTAALEEEAEHPEELSWPTMEAF